MTSNINSTTPAMLRLTDPVGLIEAVPYLIGFPPTDSVVFIGLTGDHGSHRLVLTARVDLDAVFDGEGLGRVRGPLTAPALRGSSSWCTTTRPRRTRTGRTTNGRGLVSCAAGST